MSRRPALEVQGLRTLRRTLKAAGRSLDTDFKAAHQAVADVVVRAAQPRTPVGPAAGGHIRDDLRGTGQSAAAVIRAGRAARPYGGILHFGNPHTGQPGHPWIYDAMHASLPQWLGEYQTALQKILSDIEGHPGP